MIATQISKNPPENIGILYLCTGIRSDLLRNSIASLLACNSDLPVFLLADRPYDVPFKWVESLTGKASRHIKTQLFKYSPFELTLFADVDTVFQKKINVEETLGDADLAIALDHWSNLKLASSLAKMPGHVSHDELRETILSCGEDHPFFNSGVMLWRNTLRVQELFDRWHTQWLKYKNCDQFALVRALKETNFPIKTLSGSYNLPLYRHSRACGRSAHIHHLIGKEDAAKRFGLWHPPAAGPFEVSFINAVKAGLMTANQYQHIAFEIYNHRPCNLLVIGNGEDFEFWSHCTQQNCRYVVEPHCANGSLNGEKFNFESRLGEWGQVPPPPEKINRKWDYVIVQGPRGYNRDCPGRQISIAWASQLSQKMIFVLDYERPWEREICDHYLGAPNRVVDADGRKDKKLATFKIT